MEYQSGAVRPIGNIQEGWEMIKDDYWTYFAMTLAAFAIIIVAAIVFGLVNNVITAGLSTVFGAAAGGNPSDAARASAAIVPQIISMVISFFTNIVVGTLSGALFCGIYKSLSKKANGEYAEFGDLFGGFQKIQSCLIVAATLAVVQFVISLIGLAGGAALGFSALSSGMLTKNGQLNPAVFGGFFLAVLAFVIVVAVVNLLISALTSFAYPLIADRDLSGGEALGLSIKSGLANIGGMLGLLILLFIMAIIGTLLCFVGVLFVAPILTAALFAAYQSVFGRTGNFYQQTPPPPPNFGGQPGY